MDARAVAGDWQTEDRQGESRPSLSRRGLLIGGSLIMAAGLAAKLRPRSEEHLLMRERLEDIVPQRIGGWQNAGSAGVIVSQPEEGLVEAGYDQVLTRVYSTASQISVMLLIAYGSTQGGSLQLHRPETCYPGQGFKLGAFSDGRMVLGQRADVHTRTFTARRDDRNERVTYWTRIGEFFPLSSMQEYRAILSSVARGLVPDGILVRVSMQGSDQSVDDALLHQFIVDLITALPPLGQKLLLGAAR
ncbi:MAG: exosortase C-terminal domain/associated protein EpsI [Novosphingobium sp.]